jgi:hypothetical protein
MLGERKVRVFSIKLKYNVANILNTLYACFCWSFTGKLKPAGAALCPRHLAPMCEDVRASLCPSRIAQTLIT